MVPSSKWNLPVVVFTLIAVIQYWLVVIMSIGALRLYRGLVDSTVIDQRCHTAAEVAGVIKRPTITVMSTNSDIQFASPIPKQGDGLRSLESGIA
jgi:hypothetical protein